MNELHALEERLHKLYKDGGLSDSRQLFEIGVQFGRVIERTGMDGYEFMFWKHLDDLNADWKKRWKAKEVLERLILKLVCLSVNEYINENGSWGVSTTGWGSDVEAFGEGVFTKFNVQLLRVAESDECENFDCRFKVVGQLATVFKDYGVGEEFNVVIENSSGGHELEFHNSNQVSSGFINASVYVDDKMSADKLNELTQEIGKLFLFEFMGFQ
jgi:hypothetical protein